MKDQGSAIDGAAEVIVTPRNGFVAAALANGAAAAALSSARNSVVSSISGISESINLSEEVSADERIAVSLSRTAQHAFCASKEQPLLDSLILLDEDSDSCQHAFGYLQTDDDLYERWRTVGRGGSVEKSANSLPSNAKTRAKVKPARTHHLSGWETTAERRAKSAQQRAKREKVQKTPSETAASRRSKSHFEKGGANLHDKYLSSGTENDYKFFHYTDTARYIQQYRKDKSVSNSSVRSYTNVPAVENLLGGPYQRWDASEATFPLKLDLPKPDYTSIRHRLGLMQATSGDPSFARPELYPHRQLIVADQPSPYYRMSAKDASMSHKELRSPVPPGCISPVAFRPPPVSKSQGFIPGRVIGTDSTSISTTKSPGCCELLTASSNAGAGSLSATGSQMLIDKSQIAKCEQTRDRRRDGDVTTPTDGTTTRLSDLSMTNNADSKSSPPPTASSRVAHYSATQNLAPLATATAAPTGKTEPDSAVAMPLMWHRPRTRLFNRCYLDDDDSAPAPSETRAASRATTPGRDFKLRSMLAAEIDHLKKADDAARPSSSRPASVKRTYGARSRADVSDDAESDDNKPIILVSRPQLRHVAERRSNQSVAADARSRREVGGAARRTSTADSNGNFVRITDLLRIKNRQQGRALARNWTASRTSVSGDARSHSQKK